MSTHAAGPPGAGERAAAARLRARARDAIPCSTCSTARAAAPTTGWRRATPRPRRAKYPMIVVMPDAGYDSNGGSWFTNWVDQQTPLGTANWETFHIAQLIPWIDANLRTIANRSRTGDRRAVAGRLRLDELRGAASGPVRLGRRRSPARPTSRPTRSRRQRPRRSSAPPRSASTASSRTPSSARTPITRSTGRDTTRRRWSPTCARSTSSCGRATACRVRTTRPATPTPSGSAIEAIVHQSAQFFTQAATAAKVPYYFDDYGAGTHTWPYWTRDLTQYLPRLARVFAHPPAAPSSISYRSIDKTWRSGAGRSPTIASAAQDWSALRHADAAPLRAGHDRIGPRDHAAALPPGLAPPHHDLGRDRPKSVTAGRGGRLRLQVTRRRGRRR